MISEHRAPSFSPDSHQGPPPGEEERLQRERDSRNRLRRIRMDVKDGTVKIPETKASTPSVHEVKFQNIVSAIKRSARQRDEEYLRAKAEFRVNEARPVDDVLSEFVAKEQAGQTASQNTRNAMSRDQITQKHLDSIEDQMEFLSPGIMPLLLRTDIGGRAKLAWRIATAPRMGDGTDLRQLVDAWHGELAASANQHHHASTVEGKFDERIGTVSAAATKKVAENIRRQDPSKSDQEALEEAFDNGIGLAAGFDDAHRTTKAMQQDVLKNTWHIPRDQQKDLREGLEHLGGHESRIADKRDQEILDRMERHEVSVRKEQADDQRLTWSEPPTKKKSWFTSLFSSEK